MKYLFSLCLFFLLGTLLPLTAQRAELSDNARAIPPDLFGYNNSTWNSQLRWDSQALRQSAGRLRMGNVRYPGGTVSNFWDWRTGTVMTTIDTLWPKYLADRPKFTPATFVAGVPDGTSIIYCVNLARPTPATGISPYASPAVLAHDTTLRKKIADIIAGIDAFRAAGHPLKYVELGNEFYHGAEGGVNGQGGIYTGNAPLYVRHANELAAAIHAYDPGIKMAILLERAANTNRDIKPFTDTIYHALADDSLTNIDAVTLHWYAGPGVDTLTNAREAIQALGQSFNYARGVKNRDYGNVPEGQAIWVTEMNTWADSISPIQDTWINGMVGANLAMQYAAMGDKVDLLNLHALATGGNLQWNMLRNDSTLSGNGVALALVGRAMNGMTELRPLRLTGLGENTFGKNYPAVYGYHYSNADRSSVIFVNNIDRAATNIDVSALFTGTGDRRMTQFHSPTPWQKSVNESNERIAYNYNDRLGDRLSLPPFSITVIEQERENLLANGSFERDGEGWQQQVVTNRRRDAATGRRALSLSTPVQGWQSARQEVTVAPGTEYTLRSLVQPTLSRGTARIKVSFYDAKGTELRPAAFSPSVSGTTGYRPLELTFRTPTGTATAVVTPQLAFGTGRVYFDDLNLLRTAGNTTVRQPSPSSTLTSDPLTTIYPNPVTDVLYIEGGQSATQYSVLDLQGRALLQGAGPQVDVSRLPAGTYLLTIGGDRHRFVKQ